MDDEEGLDLYVRASFRNFCRGEKFESPRFFLLGGGGGGGNLIDIITEH